jgi:hypothetical protein
MRTDQKNKLRIALHEVMAKRHGHSLDERVAALEHAIALIGEILLVDSDRREPRPKIGE